MQLGEHLLHSISTNPLLHVSHVSDGLADGSICGKKESLMSHCCIYFFQNLHPLPVLFLELLFFSALPITFPTTF